MTARAVARRLYQETAGLPTISSKEHVPDQPHEDEALETAGGLVTTIPRRALKP